jgi:hypothetical protein
MPLMAERVTVIREPAGSPVSSSPEMRIMESSRIIPEGIIFAVFAVCISAIPIILFADTLGEYIV